jgi:nucleotide-binding universal stress UspA family protein
MSDFTHILVPTDFSESAKQALAVAESMALKYGAKLTLLHTYDVPNPLDIYAGAPPIPVEYIQTLEEAAQRRLDAAVDEVRKQVPGARGVLQRGAAADRILEVAKTQAASIIVMGTHGRRGLKHALLGSVAEKIVRLSPIPVLTVHAAEG